MPDVGCRIRDAELNDAAELANLMCQLGYPTTAPEMETRLKAILASAAYKTLVAIVDDRICGMIGTFAHSTYEHDDPSGRIISLVTSNTARRHGIGRALIVAVERDFARRGIRRVALDMRLTREDAHRFYEALGYERNGWRFVKQLPASNY